MADVQQLLMKSRAVLATAGAQHTLDDHTKKKWGLIEQTLGIMQAAAKEFDERCTSNIEWIGASLKSELSQIASGNTSVEKVDELMATLYRFVMEVNLTTAGELSMELRALLRFVEEHGGTLHSTAQEQITFADRSMPIFIMKRLLGSDVLQNVRNVKKFSEKVDSTFTEWEKRLDERQKQADALTEAIKKHETAFNFVGLFKGFDDLSKQKRTELRVQRTAVGVLGILALAPVLTEVGVIAWKYDLVEQLKWPLLASAVPALSLTVILVYFFRLAVRAADNAKSQLLQIELRKTLCQFVQDYANYAKRIREGSPDLLTKFESVIFSGIVSNEEKIPATFDGLDQLSNLVKAVRGT